MRSEGGRSVWAITLFLAAIGIAVAARRLLLLASGTPAGPAAVDAAFSRHRVLTALHAAPGLLFMILGPLQFARGLRSRHLGLHRWTGRVFLVSAATVGVTALAMAPQMAIGGPVESAAAIFYGALFLFALAKAFVEIRAARVALHREWMIRAFAIGLAVAAIRPIIGFFFATSRLTHLTPREFFGPAFWIGFTAMAAAAEGWIRYTRPAARIEESAPTS